MSIRSRAFRIHASLVAGATLAAVVCATAQQVPDAPVFRSAATLVTASVSVKRGNRPVAGLTAADFIVTDNGVLQTVERVIFEEVPIDVTVVIDLSGSTTSIVDEIRRDTRRILSFLRPIDRARVVSIDSFVHEPIPLQPVTRDMGLPERIESGGNSSIRDAIVAALITDADPDRRRLVVAITDGDDTMSINEASTVLDLARHGDTVLHLVFVRPPSFGPPPPATARGAVPRVQVLGPLVRRRTFVAEWDLLLDAAVMTGGAFHGAKHGNLEASAEDAVSVFRRVFEEFRQSYVVQFTPENVPPTGWHELVVKVKGVDDKGVRARRGYFAGR